MSGPEILAAEVIPVVSLGAILAGMAAFAARRTLISRGGGVVECGLRHAGQWHPGVARYQPDHLLWYRAPGLSLRADQCFDRRGLTVIASRPASPHEAASLGRDLLIVKCAVDAGHGRHRDEESASFPAAMPDVAELALSAGALMGLLAWLEAARPAHLRQAG